MIAANQQSLQVQLNTGDLTSRRLPLSRLRSSTLSRPGTATSTSQSDTLARPRTSSGPNLVSLASLQTLDQAQQKERGGPPFRLHARDSHLPYQLPPKPWVERESTKRHSLNVQTSTISSSSSVPAIVGNHRSSPSLGPRSKTHVDLLDATIKPLDFYDRVAATGARTYGEDVADRNRNQSMTSSQAENAFGPEHSHGPRQRHSIGYGLQTSSRRPLSQLAPETIEATPEGALVTKRKADKAAKRLSMPVSASTDSIAGASQRARAHENELTAFPPSLKEMAAAMAANELAIIRATGAMPKPNRIRLDATKEASLTILDPEAAKTAVTISTPVRVQKVASSSATQCQSIRQGTISSQQNSPVSRKHNPRQRSRNISGASLTVSSIKQFDLENPIPDRSSSLRNWSITSGSITAHTHDYESNPFRPQSSHTTQTSVDLTPFTPTFKVESPSRASLNTSISQSSLDYKQVNARYSTRHTTLKKSPLGPEMSFPSSKKAEAAPNLHADQFNIDDYISSDDSFGSPRRNRGDEERELLFADDSFGLTFQLPGISEPARPEYPEASQSMNSQTLSLNAFNDFSDYGRTHSFGQISSVRTRGQRQPESRSAASHSKDYNFSMPTYQGDDWEEREDSGVDADSEDDWSMDIPMRRDAPLRQHHQSKSARHHHQAPRLRIEDGFDGRQSGSMRPHYDTRDAHRSRNVQRAYTRDY